MATPKPQPTALKILKGNPSKRPLPENEPQPVLTARVPNAPPHLKGEARKEWYSISKKLHRLGLLTEIDVNALALYCQAFGRWVDAQKEIDKRGLLATTTNGNLVQSPYVGIANTAMRDCYTYLTAFGMTPSSRTKVTAAKSGPKSKFTGLITGGKSK